MITILRAQVRVVYVKKTGNNNMVLIIHFNYN